jgi:hypothetical protein
MKSFLYSIMTLVIFTKTQSSFAAAAIIVDCAQTDLIKKIDLCRSEFSTNLVVIVSVLGAAASLALLPNTAAWAIGKGAIIMLEEGPYEEQVSIELENILETNLPFLSPKDHELVLTELVTNARDINNSQSIGIPKLSKESLHSLIALKHYSHRQRETIQSFLVTN